MSRTVTRQQNPGRATDAAGRGPGRSRRYIHIPKTSGERIADAVATSMGSWRFIIAQSSFIARRGACGQDPDRLDEATDPPQARSRQTRG